MDSTTIIKDLVIPCLREFGFPVVVALAALGLCGAMAWQMHKFVTGQLVAVIERSSTALQSGADAGRQTQAELARLAEKIEHCPDRQESEFERQWLKRHQTEAIGQT
jgi:hypothetical protein